MNAIEIVRLADSDACRCEGDYLAWCAVCSRSTCHAGEHSTSQLLGYAARHRVAPIDVEALRVATLLDAWHDNTWRLRP